MHLSTIGVFVDLALAIIGSQLTMPFLVAGLPSNVSTSDEVVRRYTQLLDWLANTDSEITFIGKPIPRGLSAESIKDTLAVQEVVVYCTGAVSQNQCTGPCNVYNDVTGVCLSTPNTTCVWAMTDIKFCSSANCSRPCTDFSACPAGRLQNDFCKAPATISINVTGTM